jgi:hypothetical protein
VSRAEGAEAVGLVAVQMQERLWHLRGQRQESEGVREMGDMEDEGRERARYKSRACADLILTLRCLQFHGSRLQLG